MAKLTAVYGDQWGDILDRPGDSCVEIRWHDTTVDMTRDDFQEFLEVFAAAVEACGRPGCLIDAVVFRMDTALMDAAWRDQHIIPRYNSAGVGKFAFIMPAGMPAIGAEPSPEGSAHFPTAYFATRTDALKWLQT